jgi:hypothetical protein
MEAPLTSGKVPQVASAAKTMITYRVALTVEPAS